MITQALPDFNLLLISYLNITLIFEGKTVVPRKHWPLKTLVKHSFSCCEGVPRWMVLVISVVPSLRQTYHLIDTILPPSILHFSIVYGLPYSDGGRVRYVCCHFCIWQPLNAWTNNYGAPWWPI